MPNQISWFDWLTVLFSTLRHSKGFSKASKNLHEYSIFFRNCIVLIAFEGAHLFAAYSTKSEMAYEWPHMFVLRHLTKLAFLYIKLSFCHLKSV